jgi:hypothetical protein
VSQQCFDYSVEKHGLEGNEKEAIPITVTDILKAQHKTPEEISAVEDDLLDLARIDALFAAR